MKDIMKALVYTKADGIHLTDVPTPKIEKNTDVIIRVDLSTICGTDIHIANGLLPVEDGTIIGHEFVGTIAEVGPAVKKFKVGDKVAANCITTCGECYYCKHGYTNHCEDGGWIFGYKINGCQAEYVRAPYADNSLFKISDDVDVEKLLFVGDILSTGYFGAERGDIKPGDVVVVLGSGPVGMCAMASARMFGPSKIIAIDTEKSRLEVAKKQGIADLTINPAKEDAIAIVQSLTEGKGADVSIECAGVKPTFDMSWQIVRPNGTVSVVALYNDAQELPLQIMANKNLTFRTGWVDSVHMTELISLIENGKLDLDFLITHKAPLNDILKGYDIFGGKKENCLKWVITPYVGD